MDATGLDGKDHPVKGDPNSDSRSYARKGIHELDFVVKKDTKVTTTGRIVVSDDGKSRTVTARGIDATGKKFDELLAHYDTSWNGIQLYLSYFRVSKISTGRDLGHKHHP